MRHPFDGVIVPKAQTEVAGPSEPTGNGRRTFLQAMLAAIGGLFGLGLFNKAHALIATTLAVGEEGGRPPIFTLAIGEDGGGPVTTLALGEEGSNPKPTENNSESGGNPAPKPTENKGENGGNPAPKPTNNNSESGGVTPINPPFTTLAIGEEGGPGTTFRFREEGGGPIITTHAVGEEGGGPPIATTLALGEEGGAGLR